MNFPSTYTPVYNRSSLLTSLGCELSSSTSPLISTIIQPTKKLLSSSARDFIPKTFNSKLIQNRDAQQQKLSSIKRNNINSEENKIENTNTSTLPQIQTCTAERDDNLVEYQRVFVTPVENLIESCSSPSLNAKDDEQINCELEIW